MRKNKNSHFFGVVKITKVFKSIFVMENQKINRIISVLNTLENESKIGFFRWVKVTNFFLIDFCDGELLIFLIDFL